MRSSSPNRITRSWSASAFPAATGWRVASSVPPPPRLLPPRAARSPSSDAAQQDRPAMPAWFRLSSTTIRTTTRWCIWRCRKDGCVMRPCDRWTDDSTAGFDDFPTSTSKRWLLEAVSPWVASHHDRSRCPAGCSGTGRRRSDHRFGGPQLPSDRGLPRLLCAVGSPLRSPCCPLERPTSKPRYTVPWLLGLPVAWDGVTET